MKTEELIVSYQAIYNTLDGLTVSGVENCAAIGGCGKHVLGQLQKLKDMQEEEQRIEKIISEQTAQASEDDPS